MTRRQYVQTELCRVPNPAGGKDLVNYATFPITDENREQALKDIAEGKARLVEVDEPEESPCCCHDAAYPATPDDCCNPAGWTFTLSDDTTTITFKLS